MVLCFIFTTCFSNVIDAAVFNEIAKLPLSTSVLLYKNDFMAIYIFIQALKVKPTYLILDYSQLQKILFCGQN